jgi:hypothetical protein
MTPIQLFEGSRTNRGRKPLGDERYLAERRLAALAVRQHEDTARSLSTSPARPHDGRLYRCLRQICGVGAAETR